MFNADFFNMILFFMWPIYAKIAKLNGQAASPNTPSTTKTLRLPG
jgi:hypothetical protein